MNTQEKIQEKVLKYLKFQFGNAKFILDKKLFDGQDGVELYGFNTIKILVQELGQEIHFLPVFNKN